MLQLVIQFESRRVAVDVLHVVSLLFRSLLFYLVPMRLMARVDNTLCSAVPLIVILCIED